jgi:hypothetical protein
VTSIVQITLSITYTSSLHQQPALQLKQRLVWGKQKAVDVVRHAACKQEKYYTQLPTLQLNQHVRGGGRGQQGNNSKQQMQLLDKEV